MQFYTNNNFDAAIDSTSTAKDGNGKGRISYWTYIPDADFLAAVYSNSVPKAVVQNYIQAIDEYLEQSTDTGEDYFTAINHKNKLELYLDCDVSFDDELIVPTTTTAPTYQEKEKKVPLDQQCLVAEIQQLIEENPPQSKLNELLPFLAKLAGISSRDIQVLYASHLADFETKRSPAELRKDVEELLALGGQSLNLHEYLPRSLAEPLLRLADRMAIRPEVFLVTLLTAISSLHKVGTCLTISAEDKFIVPPNLFSGLIAESGQKKSPVLRVLVKYPLDALESNANEILKHQYQSELEDYNSCPESERKEQFPQGEPSSPTPIDYYFSEGTVEGINRQFSRFPERGLLYLRDELAGVFGSYNKHRSGRGSDRQDFLSFYDGFGKKELLADGFISRNSQVLLSIFGTIQPDILRQLMKDPMDADGQWSRFLFVIQPLQPASLQTAGSYDINTDLLNPLYAKIDRLPVMHYKLEPGAFTFYQRHYNQLEIKRTTHPEPAMRAVYSKMEGTIGRLAINLHVLHELIGRNSPITEVIPRIRMVEACKLARFFINQVRLIHSTVACDVEEGEIASHLAAIVEKSRLVGAVNARDMQRSNNVLRNTSAQEIRGYFRQLEELDYGKCEGVGAKMTFTVCSTSAQISNSKSQLTHNDCNGM